MLLVRFHRTWRRGPDRHCQVGSPQAAPGRLIRTGALYAVIGLFRLARAVRARRHGRLLLAGAVLTAAGIVLPSAMAVIAGTLILLRGVAVTLGVSEPRRRLNDAPGRADFFGFGTRPYPGPSGQNRT